jgi:hypothetical protein
VGATQNPYASQEKDWSNPYATQDNPELLNLISQSNADIGDAYNRTTKQQTDAAAIRGGAFGGSSYNETTGNNNRALADSLARNTTGIRSKQYDTAAQLTEAGLGRNQAQWNANAGLNESALGRQMQAAGMMPGYDAQSLANNQAYMGQANQAYDVQQNLLNSYQQYFKDTSLAPAQGMDMLMNWLMTLNGAGGKTTQQISGASPWTTAAGLGALGASAYSAWG